MIKPVTAASYIRKADRALATARRSLAKSDTEDACNRAYYAMFHAAHAALWMVGLQETGTVIKSHGGLISFFGQELVKTGVLDAAHGRALGHVQKTRVLADYTADAPDEADAKEAVAQAEAFVAAIKAKFSL